MRSIMGLGLMIMGAAAAVSCIPPGTEGGEYARTKSVFWVAGAGNSCVIRRLDLLTPGAAAADVVTLPNYGVRKLLVDSRQGRLYWSERTFGWSIYRSRLDGTQITEVIFDADGLIGDFCLDPGRNALYWSNIATGSLSAARLDGTGRRALLTGPETANSYSLAVDRSARTLYWSSGSYIYRADPEASPVVIDECYDFGPAPMAAAGMAPEICGGTLFCAILTGGDGLAAIDVGSGRSVPIYTAHMQVYGPAVDIVNRKLYLFDTGVDFRAVRMNFDGTGVETKVISEAGFIPSLAFEYE